MADPITSPDGKFLWTGSDWIPAPPASTTDASSLIDSDSPSESQSTDVSLQDSVVGGDVVINQSIQNNPEDIAAAMVSAIKELGFTGSSSPSELSEQKQEEVQNLLNQIQEREMSFEPWAEISFGDAAESLYEYDVAEKHYLSALSRFVENGSKNGEAAALYRIGKTTLLNPHSSVHDGNAPVEQRREIIQNALKSIELSISLYQNIGDWRGEVDIRAKYPDILLMIPKEYAPSDVHQQGMQCYKEAIRIHDEEQPTVPMHSYIEAQLGLAHSDHTFIERMGHYRAAYDAKDILLRELSCVIDEPGDQDEDVYWLEEYRIMCMLRDIQHFFEGHYLSQIDEKGVTNDALAVLEIDNEWIYHELAYRKLPFFNKEGGPQLAGLFGQETGRFEPHSKEKGLIYTCSPAKDSPFDNMRFEEYYGEFNQKMSPLWERYLEKIEADWCGDEHRGGTFEQALQKKGYFGAIQKEEKPDSRTDESRLREYIDRAIANGESKEQMSEALRASGWPYSEINKYL